MMRSTLSTVAFVSLLAACGGPPEGAASPATAAPAAPSAAAPAGAVKEFGDAKVGDTTKCPVSGEEFVVEASSPKVEHEGKTYYFCCSGCKKKFEAEPAKFVKKS
jgi:Cu+-exporting ATPase